MRTFRGQQETTPKMEETGSSEMPVNVYQNKRCQSRQLCDKAKISNLTAENHNHFYTLGLFSPFSLSFLLLKSEAEAKPQMGNGLYCVFWIIRLEPRIL
jgi:hypothetical protein